MSNEKPKIYVEIGYRENLYEARLYSDYKMKKLKGLGLHELKEYAIDEALADYMKSNFEIIENSQEQGGAE